MIQAENDDRYDAPASFVGEWGRRTPLVFAAFAVVATIIAGFAHPGAGLAILTLGLLTLVAVDFGTWVEGEVKNGRRADRPARAELARNLLEHLALGSPQRPARPGGRAINPTDLVPVRFASAIPSVGGAGEEPPKPSLMRRTSRARVGRPMLD